MTNKKFLDCINKCLMSEGIINAVKSVIPTSQNIKKAQQGESAIGRFASKAGNLLDTLKAMGNAAERGDTKEFVQAFNKGINTNAEMNAKWKNKQYILKQNFLKDIKKGDIFIVNKNDDLVTTLISAYSDINKDIGNTLRLVVVRTEKMRYNEFKTFNINLDQQWGKIYAIPEDEHIKHLFESYGIWGLYISFNAELIGNQCSCTWVDKNYNPISSFEQAQKAVKKTQDGYLLSEYSGGDANTLISDFLKTINSNFPKTNEFIENLVGIANKVASRSSRISGATGINAIYDGWLQYFTENIDPKNHSWIKNLKRNNIVDYFTKTIPISITTKAPIAGAPPTVVANIRQTLDAVLNPKTTT